MISQILTASVIGLDVYKILVEVDVNNSLPAVSIVGLPDASISEAKERVRSAIKNSGYQFPNKKIVVNLAPADIKKMGSYYDLPIAVGILSKTGVITNNEFYDTAFIGELSLDGSLRAVSGVLPIAAGLLEQGIKTLIVPFENAFTVAKFDAKKTERFERIAFEASKQCGRAKLTAVRDCIKFNLLVKELENFDKVIFCNEYETENMMLDSLL